MQRAGGARLALHLGDAELLAEAVDESSRLEQRGAALSAFGLGGRFLGGFGVFENQSGWVWFGSLVVDLLWVDWFEGFFLWVLVWVSSGFMVVLSSLVVSFIDFIGCLKNTLQLSARAQKRPKL